MWREVVSGLLPPGWGCATDGVTNQICDRVQLAACTGVCAEACNQLCPDDQQQAHRTYQQLALASEWVVYLVDNVHIKEGHGPPKITGNAK